jgi:hypothetical protein
MEPKECVYIHTTRPDHRHKQKQMRGMHAYARALIDRQAGRMRSIVLYLRRRAKQ